MNALLRRFFGAGVGLAVAFGTAQAQPVSGAEARLKEKNITLPPESAPVANFVNAVRVGNLLFMAGNTRGAAMGRKGQGGQRSHRRTRLSGCPRHRSDHIVESARGLGQPRSRQARREGPRHGQCSRWLWRDASGDKRIFRPDGRGVRRIDRQACAQRRRHRGASW